MSLVLDKLLFVLKLTKKKQKEKKGKRVLMFMLWKVFSLCSLLTDRKQNQWIVDGKKVDGTFQDYLDFFCWLRLNLCPLLCL